ncbi:MAG: FKBP-type peptidyl-prolyl cis-trans isomerase [Bacteroidetes bacterium]|nr:FKBP-type peptidyl-prolyl cis-trans isomerase [Bacteroidota bacterium]
MVKKYLTLALAGATSIAVTSCNAQSGSFKTLPSGLQYKIVKDDPSIQKPAIGDYMEFHIKSFIKFNGKDSMLFDSRVMNNNQPVPFQVAPPAFKGDLAEGFQLLTQGDSALFRVPVDSIIKAGNQTLPWMKKGAKQYIEYSVAVTKVMTADQMKKEQEAAAGKQVAIDEQIIKDYIAKNNIKAERTASGLYYIIEKLGTGPKANQGDSVSMNYTGTTLDGTKFDSNVDPAFHHVEPFWFNLGIGQVIKGWDEGIALMPKGSKGKLIIPSTLAYGPQSPTPAIPANSVLVFDVEVKDVKGK